MIARDESWRVTGRMWAPFGWHDGKRVGEVSWKAAVEEIALPAK